MYRIPYSLGERSKSGTEYCNGAQCRVRKMVMLLGAEQGTLPGGGGGNDT